MPRTSTEPGRKLADLLDAMLLDPVRKPFGMYGQIQIGVRNVTPDTLTVGITASKERDTPARIALNVRNAVLAVLRDMVPCPKFRAICSNERLGIADEEHVLDFYPLVQHAGTLESSVFLIEENAKPHRAKFRPPIAELWSQLVASVN
jgi:hypothetical protein